MKKIGFIGLGIMGLAMSENLLKAGYDLVVHNRTSGKTDRLAALGASVCASPAEVAARAEAVVIMVKADQDVEDVVLGKEGVLAGAVPGMVILNGTTILPATSQRLAATAAAHGVDMLDCPVTGSAPQARDGKLTFMVGGSKDAFAASKPVLLAMGKAAYYLGASGTGSYAKLANNTMYAINLLSFVEALMIASKSGIDPELFIEIVGNGGAKSLVSEAKLAKIVGRDFSPAFSLAMLGKDMGLVGQLSADLGVSTPVLNAVKGVLREALATGIGDEDVSSIVKWYEADAGHVIKK